MCIRYIIQLGPQAICHNWTFGALVDVISLHGPCLAITRFRVFGLKFGVEGLGS